MNRKTESAWAACLTLLVLLLIAATGQAVIESGLQVKPFGYQVFIPM